jgi:hypothetical protein
MPSDVDDQFWGAVTERIKPEEVTEGTPIYIETAAGGQYYRVIEEIWIDGHGIHQARLRYPTPGELAAIEAGTVQTLVWRETS